MNGTSKGVWLASVISQMIDDLEIKSGQKLLLSCQLVAEGLGLHEVYQIPVIGKCWDHVPGIESLIDRSEAFGESMSSRVLQAQDGGK